MPEILVVCHTYITDILRYKQFAIFGSALKNTSSTSNKVLHNFKNVALKMRFFDNLLNNEIIILLSLTEYRLI